ncbi:MAG TPA: polysaccharide biosynthesis/export family protein [Verrucomicrobiaceae bacterium]
MKPSRILHSLALTAAVVVIPACDWNLASKVKVPFVGERAPAEEDPKLSYDGRRALGYGDTLKVAVYRNFLSPARSYEGSVMVNRDGMIHFNKVVEVRVGGRNAYQAVKAIEAAFSREYGDKTISVQLYSIEDVKLVTIQGAVRSPGVIRWFDGMTADAALSNVGGRSSRGDASAIHVTREGLRHFHAQSGGVSLEAGDVLDFSGDL